jgi:Flp pilus assembly protein TadD
MLSAVLAPGALAQQAQFDPKQCEGRTAQDCNDLMGSFDVSPEKRGQILLTRATALLQQHDLPGAIAEYREMTVIDTHSLLAFSTLGFLESIGENWKDAATDLKRAVEIAPDQDGIRAMLAMALAKGGDCTGAKAALTEAKAKVQDPSHLTTAEQTVASACP